GDARLGRGHPGGLRGAPRGEVVALRAGRDGSRPRALPAQDDGAHRERAPPRGGGGADAVPRDPQGAQAQAPHRVGRRDGGGQAVGAPPAEPGAGRHQRQHHPGHCRRRGRLGLTTDRSGAPGSPGAPDKEPTVDASHIGKYLLVAALVLAVTGLLLLLAGGLGLGRLPGDFAFGKKNVRVYVPIATSIILSVVGTIVLNLFFRRR